VLNQHYHFEPTARVGVQLYVDDFGSLLLSKPVPRSPEIDRSLSTRDSEGGEIVRAIITLAHICEWM